jgi:hypothetical protein
MAFMITVTLAALALIALGALGAFALRLRSELRAARAEIDALKVRLAMPTLQVDIGPQWRQAQTISLESVSWPLAAMAPPSPDLAAPPAWPVDPPKPNAPSPARPARPSLRSAGRQIAPMTGPKLSADTLGHSLFPATSADPTPADGDQAGPDRTVPGPALGAALCGVYAMAAAAGFLFSWPWPATLCLLLALSGATATGLRRRDKPAGLCLSFALAGTAPWTATFMGAPLGVAAPIAAGVAAMAALSGLGWRQPALTWTAAALATLGSIALGALASVSAGAPALAPAALAAATLSMLGLVQASAAPDAPSRWAASALHAAALAALAAGAAGFGVGGAFGWGLALVVAATLALAHGPARDAALISVWLAACAGLFSLSGDVLATPAMTPAAALAGAGFLGAGLVRTPRPESHGLVLFALAAAAPLAAVPLALDGPAAGIGFGAVAALLGLGFARAAQACGGARQTTLAAWPLALGAVSAGAGALNAAAPPALIGPLAAAAAVSLSLTAARTKAPAVAAAAAASAVFACLAVLDAVRLAPSAASSWTGAILAAAALLLGAWLLSTRRLGGAPATGLTLGVFGVLTAIAAPLFLFPEVAFDLRGAGAIASAWLALGLVLCALGERDGAAQHAGLAAAAAGSGLATWALIGTANPWWSPEALPLPAGAAGTALLLGAGLPAFLSAAMAAATASGGRRRASAAFGASAVALTLAGAALALRSAAFGPAGLSGQSVSSIELIGLTLTMAGLGGTLAMAPNLTARRAGLGLLAAAAVKFTLLDLHAAGLAPAFASAALGLVLLWAAIAARSRLQALWRADPQSWRAPIKALEQASP